MASSSFMLIGIVLKKFGEFRRKAVRQKKSPMAWARALLAGSTFLPTEHFFLSLSFSIILPHGNWLLFPRAEVPPYTRSTYPEEPHACAGPRLALVCNT